MRLFKKKGSKNYPLSLLGDNNLIEALENDTTPQFSFPVGKDFELSTNHSCIGERILSTTIQKRCYLCSNARTATKTVRSGKTARRGKSNQHCVQDAVLKSPIKQPSPRSSSPLLTVAPNVSIVSKRS